MTGAGAPEGRARAHGRWAVRVGCAEEVGAAGVQSRRARAARQREACLLLQGEQSEDAGLCASPQLAGGSGR